MKTRRRGWTIRWFDLDTGERCSEYIGGGKSAAIKALRRQTPSNDWGMDVRLAARGELPDFVADNGRVQVRIVLT